MSLPAYQGKGWKPRRRGLSKAVWAELRVNSEWNDLREVLLYCPGKELAKIRDPHKVQHLRAIKPAVLKRELAALARAYRKQGVAVHFLNPRLLPKALAAPPVNLLFQRDLFFATAEGFIVSRMASETRAGEEKFAAAQLAALGAPIRATVHANGIFEGADALWLDKKTVLCGVGARTNRDALKQLAQILNGVRVIAVNMPKGVQHLLGILQIVDCNLAVVRAEKIPAVLRKLLLARGFTLVSLDESEEIVDKQAMNFVTVKRRTIVMARGCPQTRARLKRAGIRIAAEVEISQICAAAGGIACATGILSRRLT
jgi:N-dimethylarginine dimethylaminohydrolase